MNSPDMGPVLDVLTTGSPLRQKAVRKVVKAIGELLIVVDDPVSNGIGLTLTALTGAYEKRYGRRSHK